MDTDYAERAKKVNRSGPKPLNLGGVIWVDRNALRWLADAMRVDGVGNGQLFRAAGGQWGMTAPIRAAREAAPRGSAVGLCISNKTFLQRPRQMDVFGVLSSFG